jgi:hypothetical protein
MTKKHRSVQKPDTRLSVLPTQPEVLASKDYGVLLTALKNRIQEAQLRAGLAVNRELVLLYWQIGKDVLHNQERLGWGAKVIDRLPVDLCRTFPLKHLGKDSMFELL